MKTEQEIRHMVEALEKDRGSVPEYDSFGENNWKPIDYGIEALEWVLGEREDDEISDSYK